MMELFRKLHPQEIEQLTRQQCVASDWNEVEVAESFSPDFIHCVRFSGHIRLGVFSESITEADGFSIHTGIRNATLHNCAIGDQVIIDNVSGRIANYDIADHCILQDIHTLTIEGETTFGNGTIVDCINEGGGREVVISKSLTAQTACLQACYRQHPRMVEHLQQLATQEYPASTRGFIGSHSIIRDCKTLKNIKVGNHATLQGCSSLTNGTIVSEVDSPTFVGDDVFAKNFIILDGCSIGEGSNIENCFIGQACQLGKGITTYHTLFFCNCQAFCGEIGSVFAGPYTVTHHKSTLLIAGQFSFFNAGSGTNQSNHYYRLGPIHQGTMERGAKAGSGSYILWPAHIGAFSLIKGRHLHHPDTSDMPFSYLIESDGETILVPGANMKSAGTLRDIQKWPKRDGRRGAKRDLVTFEAINPYIIQKVIRALEVLTTMEKNKEEWTSYQGCRIKYSAIAKGIQFYQSILWSFLGDNIFQHISSTNMQEIRRTLQSKRGEPLTEWTDLGGVILPRKRVEELISRIESEELKSSEIGNVLSDIHQHYEEYLLSYAITVWEKVLNQPLEEMDKHTMLESWNRWSESVQQWNELLADDAFKEFSHKMQISYQQDFEQVRGTAEKNAFIQSIEKRKAESDTQSRQYLELFKQIED